MNLDLLYPFLIWDVYHYLGFPNGPRGQTETLVDNRKGRGEQLGLLQLGQGGRQVGEGSGRPGWLGSFPFVLSPKDAPGANQKALCVHFVAGEQTRHLGKGASDL